MVGQIELANCPICKLNHYCCKLLGVSRIPKSFYTSPAVSHCVNQQCCPCRNCQETPPETLRWGSSGGVWIFWLNHCQIQTQFSSFFFSFFLKILSGFAGELVKKNWRPPVGGLRMISVGTTLLVHTVHSFVSTGSPLIGRFFGPRKNFLNSIYF